MGMRDCIGTHDLPARPRCQACLSDYIAVNASGQLFRWPGGSRAGDREEVKWWERGEPWFTTGLPDRDQYHLSGKSYPDDKTLWRILQNRPFITGEQDG